MDDWTWTTTAHSDAVLALEARSDRARTDGRRLRMLVLADVHFDSPHADRRLLTKLLRQAADDDCPVVCIGDFFDLMQGRHDPRRSPSDILPQYASRMDYYDAVIEDAVRTVVPTGARFAMLGRGNHEMKVLKHEGTDVLARFARDLGRETGTYPHVGGYGGWVVVRLGEATSSSWRCPVTIKYFHGAGGGGPVTRGVIGTARRAVYLPDADVVLTGHIHEEWSVTIARERLTRQGRVYLDEQLHVCVPALKEEYGDGGMGWHVERGAPPKPTGAVWLDLVVRSEQLPGRRANTYRVIPQAVRAR